MEHYVNNSLFGDNAIDHSGWDCKCIVGLMFTSLINGLNDQILLPLALLDIKELINGPVDTLQTAYRS